jgi:hypothetical protein
MLRKVNGLSVVVLRIAVHHTDVRTGQNRRLEAPPTINPKKDRAIAAKAVAIRESKAGD